MYEVRSALQCNFAIHNTYTEYFLNRNQKGDFKMTKKIISMILSIAMVLSIAVVGITGVSAAVDSDGRYVPSEGVETHRIYFAMPNSWKSAKYGADSAGIFGGMDLILMDLSREQSVLRGRVTKCRLLMLNRIFIMLISRQM